MPQSPPTEGQRASARLSDKLRTLAALKADKERIKVEADSIEREYKALESEVIEQMAEEEVQRVTVTGIGTFYLSSRNWLRVRDVAAFAEWAAEAELIRDVVIHPEADQVTITFDVNREPGEDGAEDGATLTNGLVKVEVIKKLLGEHVKEMTSNGEPHPPGIEPAITTSIALRRT